MKTRFALGLLSLWMVAARAASYPAPPIHDTLAALTNSTAYAWQPFAVASPATNEPPLVYIYDPASSAAVSSPWVLPSKSGGRWLANRMPFSRLEAIPQATNAVLTALQGLTNGTAGQVVASTGPGGFVLTNAASGGGTNRFVEQSINATNSPIAINGAAETTYVFTGAQDSSTPRYYYLPTNNVPLGALLHVVLQGTNTWTHWPLQYYFVDAASSATNRIYDNNRLDFTWSGTRWVKHGLSDWILPPGEDGLFYGWLNGGPQQIPIQGDAPFDGLEYVRKLGFWVVASGGGGGGGTNHNALAGLQGGTAGEYFHLTSAQHTDLTDSGDSGLHFHSSDRARGTHTGTQLTSTISDFSTNVWMKLLTSLLRGNGIHFATNGPSNLITISGWNLPGSNLSAVTNGDGSITWSAVASSATNGTPLSVNGGSVLSLATLLDTVISKWAVSGSNITLIITNLQQSAVSNLVADLAAKQAASTNLLQIATAGGTPGDILYRHASGVLTNLPVGSSGHVLTVASGAPAWQAAAGGGGGGSGTNFVLNGVLQQPARVTNSATVTWGTNANGDIYATAQGANATYTTNKADLPLLISTDEISLSDTSTNEVSLIGTLKPAQTKVFAANRLVSGTVLRIRAQGAFSAAGNWSGGDFRVKVGSRILTASFEEADSLTPSGLPWELVAVLTVNAAGSNASNTVTANLKYGYGNGVASVGASMISMAPSGTLDTTTTNIVDVTFQNDPTQPVSLTCGIVEVNELAANSITGGAGQFFAEGALVQNPNLIAGAGLTNQVNGTNLTVGLTDTGVGSGTATNAVVTYDGQGRITGIRSGPEPSSTSRSSFVIFDEFLGSTTTTGGQSAEGAINSGGIGIPNTEVGHYGMRYLRSAGANQGSLMGWHNTATLRGPAPAGVDQFYYEAHVKVPSTLSGAAGTDQYAIQVGFNSLNSGTNTPGDGSYLVHQTNLLGSAINWAFITTSNSTSATVIDTGIAVTNSAWYTLGVYLDATNSIAFINGVPVGTNTTRLPLSRNINAIVRAPRYGGTTTADTLIDWMKLCWQGAAR